ncbi:hypothetical protein NEOLEDRAFT_1099351, partial [Neolentinus lepideus HHB14362 ss-1]
MPWYFSFVICCLVSFCTWTCTHYIYCTSTSNNHRAVLLSRTGLSCRGCILHDPLKALSFTIYIQLLVHLMLRDPG